MSERILGPQGSQRRRRFLWVPMILVACTALFLVAGAQAVHNTKFFQLDGDAQASTKPTGVTSNGVEDWDNICAAHLGAPAPDNTPGPTCHKAPGVTLPSGGTLAERSTFISDAFNATSDNIFKGGTDDGGITAADNVSGSVWQWKQAGPSPNKADIEQAFAAQYTCTTALQTAGKCSAGSDFLGHKYVYFGGTRFANNGDTNIGIWFFHNPVTVGGIASTTDPNTGLVSCAPTSGCGFTGSHTVGNCSLPNHPNPCTPGDLFVQSAFTSKPSIKIFEWVGPGNATAPCITNACTLQPVQFVTPAGQTDNRCETTSSATVDQGCAIVNDQGEIISPWGFQDQSSKSPANMIETSELFEGGLDLTALGFGDECISTVLLNTRSSGSSVNSVAQDFALGQFGGCTSSVVTTPSVANTSPGVPGSTSITTAGSISVTDSAAVDVQGVSTWSGTVTFHLCGPADLASQANCSTGGTLIGATKTATNASKTAGSDAATITSAGKYCWRANVHFTTPATGVADASDPSDATSLSECFNVTPVQPTLSTQASGPVTLGNPISDTATILGTANQPGSPVINPTTAGAAAGGDITWTVFGPNDCTTVAAFGPTGTSRTISGDGTYPKTPGQAAVSFTPTAVGTYTFVASYGGNSPNTKNVAATACGDQPATEKVTVSSSSVVTTPSVANTSPGVPGSTSITTAGSISVTDSATVTVNGLSTWSGTVSFHLCGPADLTSQANCSTGGTAIPANKSVSNGNATVSSDAATITSAGKYCWRGDFSSSTTGVPNSSDPSDATSLSECFNVTPVQPTLSTQASGPVTLGNAISDTATILGTAKQPGSPVINPARLVRPRAATSPGRSSARTTARPWPLSERVVRAGRSRVTAPTRRAPRPRSASPRPRSAPTRSSPPMAATHPTR